MRMCSLHVNEQVGRGEERNGGLEIKGVDSVWLCPSKSYTFTFIDTHTHLHYTPLINTQIHLNLYTHSSSFIHISFIHKSISINKHLSSFIHISIIHTIIFIHK